MGVTGTMCIPLDEVKVGVHLGQMTKRTVQPFKLLQYSEFGVQQYKIVADCRSVRLVVVLVVLDKIRVLRTCVHRRRMRTRATSRGYLNILIFGSVCT